MRCRHMVCPHCTDEESAELIASLRAQLTAEKRARDDAEARAQRSADAAVDAVRVCGAQLAAVTDERDALLRLCADPGGQVQQLIGERDALRARLEERDTHMQEAERQAAAYKEQLADIRSRLVGGGLVAAMRNRLDAAEVENARLLRREPTQEEGDANERRAGKAFVDGWTGRRCRVCNRWVWGGPTACMQCAENERLREALRAVQDLIGTADQGPRAGGDGEWRIPWTPQAVAVACQVADALADARSRCETCGWPLATSAEEGCVPGDCSYRPREGLR